MFGPVLVGDRAIVCGGYGYDRDARLAAVSVAGGERLWEQVIGSCYSPPFVAGNVAVGLGMESDSVIVKAVEIDTGRLLWTRFLPGRFTTDPPVRHGTWVYLHDVARTVVGLDLRNGSYRSITIPEGDANPPLSRGMWTAADEQRVIVGYRDAVYTLHPDSASLTPLVKLEERLLRPEYVLLQGDVIYVGDKLYGRKGGATLAAFDLRTGRKLWERCCRSVSAPKILDGSLVAHIVDRKWELIALDPISGTERWRADVRGFHPPALWRGRLYVDDQRPIVPGVFRLAVLDAATGKVVDRWRVPDEISGTPVVARDTMFLGTLAGVLYAIRMNRS